MSAPLVLVDSPREPFWPLAATRPVADLLAGTRTFHARWAAREGGVAAVWVDHAVAGRASRSEPPPPAAGLPDSPDGLRVALAAWVPDAAPAFPAGPAELRLEGEPVGWRLDRAAAAAVRDAAPETPADLRARLVDLGLPPREAGGRRPASVWALMAANPDLIALDARETDGADSVTGVDPFVLLGDAADLVVGAGVSIGPFVVLDVRDGPVVLGPGARVGPHAVLRGPLAVGPDTAILGGEIGRGTTLGPRCKVRGEVEQTIVQGFANKAHDGFVGHSVLGEWVNLGAGTITSDLKNTYGPVRVGHAEGRVETGLLKAGAFLGDHVKTGIGTLLTTGARIGPASHVFGGRAVSPAWLPDFSWHDGEERRRVRWEPFERALRAAMARRGQSPSEAELAILKALHDAAP